MLCGAGLLLLLRPDERARADDFEQVAVVNFPEVQEVSGTVAVAGPTRHAALVRRADILVSPVGPEETTRLIDGGVLETDGFISVVLSLNGRPKGKIEEAGRVGAILIPEEESVLRAFETDGLMQFPLEVSAPLSPQVPRAFASEPRRSPVAFPRYHVWLYNTSETTVTVNLFAYLTN
jgi:hypothetical protein